MDFAKNDLKGEYQHKIKMGYPEGKLHGKQGKKPTNADDPDVKALGSGVKKTRAQAKDPLLGVTKPAIRRLARRGGVKRISGLMYQESRGVLKKFLYKTVHDAIAYAEHSRRQTVRSADVLHALTRAGRGMYGVDHK